MDEYTMYTDPYLDSLLFHLVLGDDAYLPEADLGEGGQLEALREHSDVQLLRVPFPDEKSVRIEEEEVYDAVVRFQRRRQQHRPDADDVLGVVNDLVGADQDGEEPAGEAELPLVLEDYPAAAGRPRSLHSETER